MVEPAPGFEPRTCCLQDSKTIADNPITTGLPQRHYLDCHHSVTLRRPVDLKIQGPEATLREISFAHVAMVIGGGIDGNSGLIRLSRIQRGQQKAGREARPRIIELPPVLLHDERPQARRANQVLRRVTAFHKDRVGARC